MKYRSVIVMPCLLLFICMTAFGHVDFAVSTPDCTSGPSLTLDVCSAKLLQKAQSSPVIIEVFCGIALPSKTARPPVTAAGVFDSLSPAIFEKPPRV